MLTKDEIERYKRHLVLKEVGGAGQQKLKASSVLMIGAGGLGAPVLSYLAAAGVGTLGIIDDDIVSLDNLQRQIIHRTSYVGIAKVESAKQTILEINPHIDVIQHQERFSALNALDILSQYDVIVDGSDNFETRYLVNDACYFAKKTLVFAAVGPFDGHLTTLKSYDTSDDGIPNPTYRCLFPDMPSAGTIPNCSEVGVLGSVVGVIGTLQATEVLKEILGIGESLIAQLMLYDVLEARFQKINYQWDPDNPLNGKDAKFKDLSHHIRCD